MITYDLSNSWLIWLMWFPSSSWSCQCSCGCGTVVKRYSCEACLNRFTLIIQHVWGATLCFLGLVPFLPKMHLTPATINMQDARRFGFIQVDSTQQIWRGWPWFWADVHAIPESVLQLSQRPVEHIQWLCFQHWMTHFWDTLIQQCF